jgi:hypothetical protein
LLYIFHKELKGFTGFIEGYFLRLTLSLVHFCKELAFLCTWTPDTAVKYVKAYHLTPRNSLKLGGAYRKIWHSFCSCVSLLNPTSKEANMSIHKLVVLIAALMLASFVGSMPVSAQVICDPNDPAADCDYDGIRNGQDTCNNLDPAADCDNDGIPNSQDTCNNLDPLLDCDGDGVPNGSDPCNDLDPEADCDNDGVANADDECPDTVEGTPLVLGDTTCVASGLDTVLPSGCSLSESLAEDLLECADGATNHGKFVSCVAKKLNALKKAKVISGNQKGQLQSCAAQSNIGQKTKPPKPPKH